MNDTNEHTSLDTSTEHAQEDNLLPTPKIGSDDYDKIFWAEVEKNEKEKKSTVPLKYSESERNKEKEAKPEAPPVEAAAEEETKAAGESEASDAKPEDDKSKEGEKPKLKEELAKEDWYNNLSEEAKREFHRVAAQERAAVGRVAHLQRTLDALKREVEQVKANPKNPPTAQPTPVQPKAPLPNWEKLKGQDSDYAAATEERLQAEAEALKQELTQQFSDALRPFAEEQRVNNERVAIEREIKTLDYNVPNWRMVADGGQLRSDYEEWVHHFLPPEDRVLALRSDSAEVLIPYLQSFGQMYDSYIQSQQRAAQSPQPTAPSEKADKVQEDRAKRLAQVVPKPSGAPKNVAEAAFDAEAHFDKEAREADARLAARMERIKPI